MSNEKPRELSARNRAIRRFQIFLPAQKEANWRLIVKNARGQGITLGDGAAYRAGNHAAVLRYRNLCPFSGRKKLRETLMAGNYLHVVPASRTGRAVRENRPRDDLRES